MALFALLIGINEYHPDSSVRPLRGCHNDVLAVHQFLYTHCRQQITDDTNLRVLLDAQADRAGVLAAFRDHLSRATAGDTALIYYCGHGSHGVTAPEFQASVTDRQEEGWVLYDSRCTGGYDLADKEIAVLLERLAMRGASVVVIADSCHSGSVTRSQEALAGWQGRFIPGTKEARPLSTYLNGEYLRRQEKTGLLTIPDSRHYLLSACDKTEVAWESDDRRGVFTKALIAALQHSSGSISYDDLYAGVRSTIRQAGQQQTPRAEAIGGFDPQAGFLGQATSTAPRRYALYRQPAAPAWTLDVGAAQGLSSDLNTALSVQVYEHPQGGAPLGQAWVLDLGATQSTLNINNLPLDSSKTYWAALEGWQAGSLSLYCPNQSDLEALETLLQERSESPLRLSNDPAGCAFSLRSDEAAWLLYEHTASGDGALIHGVQGRDATSAAYLLSVLERLARWRRLQHLHNPYTLLPDWGVRLHLQVRYGPDWETRLPDAGSDILHLPFRWQRIGLRLLADNQSGQALYFALLYLSPRYGTKLWWSSTSAVPDGHQGLSLLQDNFYLPEGVDEETDHFRLVASTEPIEPTAFPSQPDLPRAVVPPAADAGGPTRSIGSLSQPDWSVRPLSLRIVRERATDVLGEQPLTLAGGKVRIEAHPVFRATYTLEGSRMNGRGESVWPPNSPYFQDSPYFHPLPLAAARSGEMQPIFLDLSDAVQEQHLAELPLVISIKNDPEEEALSLPFWFDGVHCLPAGDWVLSDGGDLEVHVHRLPEQDPDAPTRSVGKAFKLFFFKIAKDLGFKTNTQFLRWVEYLPDGSFERHREGIREKVLEAKKVILLVHGIIGDSKTSIPPFRSMAQQEGWLVLAYDYENLNTPIEETAGHLRDQLLKMGFAPDDGRELVLVAQSMGGLVSRYFIERLGGHELADALVLTGTASKGSPLGSIADYLQMCSTLITVAMRYFAWGLPVLTGLVAALQQAGKKLFVTLRQHTVGAPFLDDLNSDFTHPPIPYHLVSADLEEFLRERRDLTLADKVLSQTGRWFFKGEINDGAVSRDSAFGVPGATTEAEPGHHMRYYEDTEAVWAERVRRVTSV